MKSTVSSIFVKTGRPDAWQPIRGRIILQPNFNAHTSFLLFSLTCFYVCTDQNPQPLLQQWGRYRQFQQRQACSVLHVMSLIMGFTTHSTSQPALALQGSPTPSLICVTVVLPSVSAHAANPSYSCSLSAPQTTLTTRVHNEPFQSLAHMNPKKPTQNISNISGIKKFQQLVFKWVKPSRSYNN